MYYSKIYTAGSGLTNQIFSLIKSIIIAYKNNNKVIIVDNFLNDFSKNKYTPISQILNIDKMNIFLKKKYDIIIIDKNNISFELYSIKYGINEAIIDLTDYVKKHHYKNDCLFISKNTILNNIKGDPCNGIKKHLFFNYKINNYNIEEIYDENLQNDICTDFMNAYYVNTFGWIDSLNKDMFENILINIEYNSDFINKSQFIIDNNIDTTDNINVLHLRLEDDAIHHWSKMNNMNADTFKLYIEDKYIALIKKYIKHTDKNIILSQSLSNRVINFLITNNYKYIFTPKFFDDREKNAIVDLLLSKKCTNIFIGNFNLVNLNGSTFSYYITKLLNPDVTTITIDLDKIYHDECVI